MAECILDDGGIGDREESGRKRVPKHVWSERVAEHVLADSFARALELSC